MSRIIKTTSTLTLADHWDHFLARWGVKRSGHRISPGLYALGTPSEESPVLVTANYTLSFDSLRTQLEGLNAYILVLDTNGVNVWCAAGKGIFGTDELVHQIETTGLQAVVRHRTLILPQLGAPGVAAHEVKKRSGFRVEYGPVRAADLLTYLVDKQMTLEMRRVYFPLKERFVLIPVEFVQAFLPMVVMSVTLFLLGGPLALVATIAAFIAGVVFFPLVFPFLPPETFSSKGFLLGIIFTIPFSFAAYTGDFYPTDQLRTGWSLTYPMLLPPVTAYLALNFTGSTPFTSKTGVEQEMKTYLPVMLWMGVGSIILLFALTIVRFLG